jgi:hypothetical protein
VSTTTVTLAIDHTLYAHWEEKPMPDPYLADPADGSENRPYQTTAYNGFVYDDNGTVRGTVTLTAKAIVKKATKAAPATTNWTFTAKAILQTATVSFSIKGGSPERVTVTTKKGETLDVALGADTFRGTLSGGAAGVGLSVAGSRNAFADRKDTAAAARLGKVKGLYNVALMETVGGEELPQGYLTLNVGALGAVKIAGKLSDGTAVSGSAKLLEGLNDDKWHAIALYKPLYVKKGFVGGLLWLNPEDQLIRVDTACGWSVDWVYDDPKKAPADLFARTLATVGGVWPGIAAEPPTVFSVGWVDDLPPPASGLSGHWVAETFPWDMPVSASGAKWTLPKAVAPKKIALKGVTPYYDYSGENSSCATLAYTAKTGLFRGAFKLYYDGYDARGALQHKTVAAAYTGVMVPTEGGGAAGIGTATVTVNRQKVGMPVFLDR